ncbi:DNA-binding protein [Mariniluteicoccus endophyticus]
MHQKSDADVTATRKRQAEVYGDSLNILLGRCSNALQLTQARMAELLGVSAPMLSQLINGKRIKIGNPAAAQRLLWMIDIAGQVERGQLSHGDAMAQLQRNSVVQDVVTGSTTSRRATRLGSEIQQVFRQAASAAEWIEAAAILKDSHPEVSELITMFGVERLDRANAYAERLVDGE